MTPVQPSPAPPDNSELAAFEAAISGWNEHLACEMPTRAGTACGRPARWRLNLHGCEQALLCGHHLRAWQRAAIESSTGRCAHCGRQFDGVADAYTVTSL
ncbi:hypothetical protein [Mycobacterium kyogaense]|uniref:hypothetical protein n=1 Tax=Mycobacterium kyogaense TaxID=2212479 RepID=UPI0013C4CDBE|nr:hypothetical protein [Mycobacterium kyogaense]